MEQENINSAQAAPGTPLRQISQDRFNQMRIPQSPSVPAYLNENNESHSRRGSDLNVSTDIKSKIAFFSHAGNGNTATNSFAIAASPTRSPIKSAFSSPAKSHSRANSTMSVCLPSDPSDLKSLVQTLHGQLEQSRNRERLVAERVESLMEQLTNAHTRSRHEQNHSEKEVKSMKKQVHKAELALIRCQAELEESRKEQEGFKMRAEHERLAKEKSRQEAFERARVVAGYVEELEVVRRERDLAVGECESLRSLQSVHMETVAEVTVPVVEMREAGVQVALENQQNQEMADNEDYICSRCANADTEEEDFAAAEMVQELQEEITWVRSQLKREKDLVHFMNMQCQFRACPCRMAEKAGVRFVHDHAYDQRRLRLAEAKGLKRKAEDELPLPQYITVRESLEQTSRERKEEVVEKPKDIPQDRVADTIQPASEEVETAKQQVIAGAITPEQEQAQIEEEEPINPHKQQEQATGQAEDDSTLRGLPVATYSGKSTCAGVIPLDQAADIPLPSPRSDDLEPTALLEDMTQVMVEPQPLTSTKHFAFSTSTSSRRPVEPETPILRQSHSAVSTSANDDLFDIAPPKHHLPPRPSTVMGLRTIESPIRMVPPSPEHRDSMTPATSPPRHRTMQIPLKDSPLKNAVTHRRSQSRPRERSRARSPTPGQNNGHTNSPSADTFFPVTPKQKFERQQPRTVQVHPHSQLQALHAQSQSQTTTTTVPLRGAEEDDVFSPDKRGARAQAFEPTSAIRGRQPLAENDPNASAQPTMLPGTPITREAALAQIRARRDRARSVAMRKQPEDDSGRGGAKTPKSAARRGVMLNREVMGRDISNLSQASAPARF